MSASLGSSLEPRRQPVVLCAAVAAGVVAGCLVFDYLWEVHGAPALAQRTVDVSIDVRALVAIVTPYLVYALALAVWGLDRRHRLAGGACALLAGLVMWGFQELLARRVADRPTQATLRDFDWAITLVLPALLALAWGLARRRGRAWVPGILVAPALAGLHHELFLRARWWWSWELRLDRWWEHALLFIAPVIVAALVCWLIERSARSQRRPEAPRPEQLQSAT